MITVILFVIAITVPITILLVRSVLLDDGGGITFLVIIIAIFGMLFSAYVIPNEMIEETKVLEDYLVKELPSGEKEFFVRREEGYIRFEIDEYVDEDIEEPY